MPKWRSSPSPDLRSTLEVAASEGAEGIVALHRGMLGVGGLDPQKVGWLHTVIETRLER